MPHPLAHRNHFTHRTSVPARAWVWLELHRMLMLKQLRKHVMAGARVVRDELKQDVS